MWIPSKVLSFRCRAMKLSLLTPNGPQINVNVVVNAKGAAFCPLTIFIYHPGLRWSSPTHLTIHPTKKTYLVYLAFCLQPPEKLFGFSILMPRKKQLKTHLSSAGRLILVAASAERSLPSKRLTVLKQTVIDSSALRIQLSHHLFTQWFRK